MKAGVIDYSGSFKALMSLIEQYNSLYVSTGKKIKSGMIRTAEILIKIYGVCLLKNNTKYQLAGESVPLMTSNAQLAKMQNCSKRTIQRHLERLELARVLIKKQSRGRELGIELWINKTLLMEKIEKEQRDKKVIGGSLSIKTSEKTKDSQDLKQEMSATKCRHSDKEEIINNKIIGVVELLGNQKNVAQGAGYTGKTHRGGLEVTVEKGEEGSGSPGGFRDFCVDMLWDLSKKLLYGKTFLAESQHLRARQLIEHLYAPVKKEHLQKVHENYCKRIGLVKKYVDKNPRMRFVPLPYIFFDTKNSFGFCGTKKWLEQMMARKRAVRKEVILLEEVTRYSENEKRKGNMKVPSLMMFRDCEKRIKAQSDDGLSKRFYEAISFLKFS
jgi:hypothetical protein